MFIQIPGKYYIWPSINAILQCIIGKNNLLVYILMAFTAILTPSVDGGLQNAPHK